MLSSLSLSCSMSIPSFLFFVICFFCFLFFYRKGAGMISCWTTHTHGIPFWYRPCPHMQPPAPFPTICDIENEHQLEEKKDKKRHTETLKPGSALQTNTRHLQPSKPLSPRHVSYPDVSLVCSYNSPLCHLQLARLTPQSIRGAPCGPFLRTTSAHLHASRSCHSSPCLWPEHALTASD